MTTQTIDTTFHKALLLKKFPNANRKLIDEYFAICSMHQDGDTEDHHILPKAKHMFPEYDWFNDEFNLGKRKDLKQFNMVKLKKVYHAIAHYKLALALNFFSTSHSLLMFKPTHPMNIARRRYINCTDEELSIITRLSNHKASSYEHNAMFEVAHSEEHSQGISKALKNLPKTEEHKANMRIARLKRNEKHANGEYSWWFDDNKKVIYDIWIANNKPKAGMLARYCQREGLNYTSNNMIAVVDEFSKHGYITLEEKLRIIRTHKNKVKQLIELQNKMAA